MPQPTPTDRALALAADHGPLPDEAIDVVLDALTEARREAS